MQVAEEFLRHAAHARAVQVARTLGAPVAAVVVDVVDTLLHPSGASAIGDADGLLLHLRVDRAASGDRRRFLDTSLTCWVTDALAPFATS